MIEIQYQITEQEYNNIRKNINWREYDSERVKEALKNTKYLVKAVDEGKAIGMARAISDGIYNTILDVAVCKEYQNKGIGMNLMKELLDLIKKDLPQNEKATIFLIAENEQAEKFYHKLDFMKVPTEEVGSGMIKIIKNI
ncbi:MAG: GNAT family N-acetyltransferase [Clostridiales bacterium]|nr:GNAT family N-acetyltransferase [Clostridiales bacterium]